GATARGAAHQLRGERGSPGPGRGVGRLGQRTAVGSDTAGRTRALTGSGAPGPRGGAAALRLGARARLSLAAPAGGRGRKPAAPDPASHRDRWLVHSPRGRGTPRPLPGVRARRGIASSGAAFPVPRLRPLAEGVAAGRRPGESPRLLAPTTGGRAARPGAADR